MGLSSYVNGTSACTDCSSCGAFVSLDDCTLKECTTYRDGLAAWIGSTTSNFPGETGTSSGGASGGDAAAVTKYIRQADLTPSYVICCPGTYVLSEPLELISPTPGTSLIYIATSDVTLDLNGYTLFYNGSDSVSGLNGVRLCPGIHNVKIINGSIREFTNAGILADATSTDTNCTGCGYASGNDITDVKIQDIVASNNKNGINFIGNSSDQVYNIAVTCVTASGNSNNGLYWDGVCCSSIMKSNFTKNVAVNTTAAGIQCRDCKTLLIRDNNADCNESNYSAYGIYISNSSGSDTTNSTGNVLAQNSTDRNKTTASATYQAAGIYLETSQNCQLIKNRSAYNAAPNLVNASYGFLMNAATIQCEITCNEAIENQIGFQDSSSTSLFKKNLGFRNLPNSADASVITGTIVSGNESANGNDGNYRNYNVTFASGSSSFAAIYRRVQLKDFAPVNDLTAYSPWLNISVVN